MTGTWNVRTLLQTGKLENLKIEMKRLKIHILGLSEMRWNGQGDFISGDYRFIYSGVDNGRNGVGIILNKKWAQCMKSHIAYDDRLIMIKFKSVPNDITIIQAYMPTTQANNEEVEVIYEKIEELISLTNSKENLIIMGNWNSIVGENTDRREVGKYRLGTRNKRGDRLVEFCRQHDLIITNTLFMNHKRRRYTYKLPGDINRYQLDYNIMVKNRYKNQIKSSKSYPGADIDSDHNLVMIKSVLKFKKLEKPKNKRHKWNLCQLKQPEITKLFEKKCKEKLETKDEESKKQYKTLRNKINREAKKAKKMWIKNNCEEIDNMMKYNQRDKAYKLIKRYFNEKKSQCIHVKDKEGNLLIDEIAIANGWKEYVELYVEEENTDLLVENLTDGDFNSNADTRILKSEFEDALKTMKKNKAPGPEKLNTELLQQAGDEIKNVLYELLCQIYETGKIPRDFGCSRLVIVPKKPRANQCENFRTLSLISHAAKLLAIIVSKRINKGIEARLANDQYGFRKNKGTREVILGLRVILEKQIERQKITYMAFVDLEKAFDSINWTSILKILEETKIDFKDRRILYKIYEEQETIININTTTVTAKIQKGVRQRCPLSPALFNVFIEKAINVIKLCLKQK
ncbi:hypothetical protein QTP88_008968 [Uroleucon formosanum]